MNRIVHDYIWGKLVPRTVAAPVEKKGAHGYLAEGVGIQMPRISPAEKLSTMVRNNTTFILDSEGNRLLSAYLTKRKYITQYLKEKFEARDWEALRNHELYKFMFTVTTKESRYATGNSQLVEEGRDIGKKIAQQWGVENGKEDSGTRVEAVVPNTAVTTSSSPAQTAHTALNPQNPDQQKTEKMVM